MALPKTLFIIEDEGVFVAEEKRSDLGEYIDDQWRTVGKYERVSQTRIRRAVEVKEEETAVEEKE